MKVEQTDWRGVAPRVSPRALPSVAGQDATNARLLTGDLSAFHQHSAAHELELSAPINTIYFLRDKWLAWQAEVEVARTGVSGDTTDRIVVTGETGIADGDPPLETDYAGATGNGTGIEPYPLAGGYTILGTPAPTGNPTDIQYHPASGVDPGPVTSYVYTYVNLRGEESAPSLAGIYQASVGPSTTPIPAPSGQGDYNSVVIPPIETAFGPYLVEKVRLYRAATGNTGTIFRFVLETSFSGGLTTLTDDLGDFELGEEIPSTLWDLPPTDLRGVITLPNGVMAGFYRNILCFSAQNYAHAWPVSYQLTTETSIIGIGNIDTTIVIFTRSHPYLAIGSDPASYSMTKLEVEHSGVSRRSIKPVLNVGVVGATPNGLLAVLGNGQVRNLTEPYFTRRQWQALTPSSIRAAVHDNIYFFSWATDSTSGSYALDTNPNGFGLIPLSMHFSAVISEPVSEQLLFVLDANSEPTNGLLPLPSTAPTPTGYTIYRFDSTLGSGGIVYRYRGKLNLLPYSAAFTFCQVRAEDYTNLVLRLLGNGVVYYEVVVVSKATIVLPIDNRYDTFEFELVGTSVVRTIRFGEQIDDLRDGTGAG